MKYPFAGSFQILSQLSFSQDLWRIFEVFHSDLNVNTAKSFTFTLDTLNYIAHHRQNNIKSYLIRSKKVTLKHDLMKKVKMKTKLISRLGWRSITITTGRIRPYKTLLRYTRFCNFSGIVKISLGPGCFFILDTS